MRFCILMGSPRKNGNTAMMVQPFQEELKKQHQEVEILWLYDYNLNPRFDCEDDWNLPDHPFQDDMQIIFDSVSQADAIILATPIYSGYCTIPMKIVLDSFSYDTNRFNSSDQKNTAPWTGKHLGVIATCSSPAVRDADLFCEGIKRYCRHYSLIFDGMTAEQDNGYHSTFIDEIKVQHAREFARNIIQSFD